MTNSTAGAYVGVPCVAGGIIVPGVLIFRCHANFPRGLQIGMYTHLSPRGGTSLLLVFSVTPFKIDENKNQNHSIDKIQNLENERRYICKDPRQDSGQRNISYTRYPKKCFTQVYRDLYGDAMLVLTWMSSNMADGNQQKHLLLSFATKA